VFEFPEEGITLTELAPGCSIDDVKQKTGCEFRVLPNYKRMDFE
jgi:acyl CoA:acetate/3-ketoacid CoA transferase beta subunit